LTSKEQTATHQRTSKGTTGIQVRYTTTTQLEDGIMTVSKENRI